MTGRDTLDATMKDFYEEKQNVVKAKIQEHLAAGGKVALTEDRWSSNRRSPYLSLAVHYIDRCIRDYFVLSKLPWSS